MKRPGPPKTKADLDSQETYELIKQIQKLDKDCDEQIFLRGKLLEQFEHWCKGMSTLKKAHYVDRNEAIQKACEAFDKAVLRFNPDGEAKLSTFASTCINNAILDLDRKEKKYVENEQSSVVSTNNEEDEDELDLIDKQAATILNPEEQMDEKMQYGMIRTVMLKYFSEEEVEIIEHKINKETTASLAIEYNMTTGEIDKLWRKFNSLRDKIRKDLGK